jgi:hypothetical protein
MAIKSFCDICSEEIKDQEAGVFQSFDKAYTLLSQLKGKPQNPMENIQRTETLLCRSCKEGVKKYLEGQKNINKK